MKNIIKSIIKKYGTSSYRREIIVAMKGYIGHPDAIRGAQMAKTAEALDLLRKDSSSCLSAGDRKNLISIANRMDEEIDLLVEQLILDGNFQIETDRDGRYPRVVRQSSITGCVDTLCVW